MKGIKKALQILQGFFRMINFDCYRLIIINANALQDTHASSNKLPYNDLKIAFLIIIDWTNVYPFNGTCKSSVGLN
jgi:hypothetical protein